MKTCSWCFQFTVSPLQLTPKSALEFWAPREGPRFSPPAAAPVAGATACGHGAGPPGWLLGERKRRCPRGPLVLSKDTCRQATPPAHPSRPRGAGNSGDTIHLSPHTRLGVRVSG